MDKIILLDSGFSFMIKVALCLFDSWKILFSDFDTDPLYIRGTKKPVLFSWFSSGVPDGAVDSRRTSGRQRCPWPCDCDRWSARA